MTVHFIFYVSVTIVFAFHCIIFATIPNRINQCYNVIGYSSLCGVSDWAFMFEAVSTALNVLYLCKVWEKINK